MFCTACGYFTKHKKGTVISNCVICSKHIHKGACLSPWEHCEVCKTNCACCIVCNPHTAEKRARCIICRVKERDEIYNHGCIAPYEHCEECGDLCGCCTECETHDTEVESLGCNICNNLLFKSRQIKKISKTPWSA